MQLDPPPRKSNRMSLTPLIDVVFLLLIFFMLASTFRNFNTLPIAASTHSGTPPTIRKIILVRINEQGKMDLNGDDVEIDDLAAEIDKLAIEPEMQLVIRPAEKAPLSALVTALQESRRSVLKNPIIAR